MNQDLIGFLVHYNLHRRHGSLRRELKVKTPFNAIEKWFELDPKIVKKRNYTNFKRVRNLKINDFLHIVS